LLVLIPEKTGGKCILFCRDRDPDREMWDGRMVGLEAAVSEYGMDEAYDIKQVESHLRDLLHDTERIFFDLGRDPLFDQRLIGWLNEFRVEARKTYHAPEEIHALDHMLHDMRVYKSRDELSVMRRSAKVAIEAHEIAMKICEPGMNEADIHASLLHTFTRHQCETSYIPIVGGGANGCVLHYIANNGILHDGDLLLIDAGAEYDGYASDITRTFPVNGKFSSEQRELYNVVLAAQSAAVEKARAGNQWQDIHDAAIRVVAEGMIELGILGHGLEEELESKGYKQFYVHNTGHWLGLDVHDVGEYTIDGHSRELEPGMVLTIEPGIYIHPQESSVEECWRGVGIRIEDNVAITQDEARILTDGLARTVDEIETLMASVNRPGHG
jgi:Xaa-Pro aminopeptidase